MKTKWIAGLAAMCLFSAAAASVFTALALSGGAFGLSLPSGSVETTASGTVPTTTSHPKATATPRPTAAPTPVPSLSPTPTPDPSAADPGSESLIIMQTQALIERVYAEASESVVSIEVQLTEAGTSIARTNQGSGVILRATGEIVTNASILDIALDGQGNLLANATVSVLVKGIEKPFTATFVGQDVMTGLAVIRIDPTLSTLKPAVFAAADTELRVGQVVLAVGYPEILYESGGLSSGLITGLGRTVLLEDGIAVQMIQTNAPVSLECSGGPLLDLDGQVLGLTNCAVTRESVDSLSYVLPFSTVLVVANDLIENGAVTGRAWLGISVLSLESFNKLQALYAFPDGLYISNVIKDSPAYTADLRKGDIITEINGEAINKNMDLSRFLQGQPVGTLVEFKVYRRSDGQYHVVQAYLQEKTS